MRDRALLGVAVAFCSAFFVLLLSHAFTDGLCCGDDAAIALVAKSLAQGQGYALPLNFIGESGKFPFHTGISTGPTLILPAAALIAVFGNEIWVPSLTSSLVSGSLLLLIGLAAGRQLGCRRGSIFTMVFVGMLYVLTGGEFFIHWYALVGEIPSVLLLTLAAILVGRSNDCESGPRLSFVAGTVAGLAVQSKLLALIGALALGANYVWGLLAGDRRKALRDGLTYTAGLLLPTLLFELFRLSALGGDGYFDWLQDTRAFMQQQVPGVGASTAAGSDTSRALANLVMIGKSTGLTFSFLLAPLLAWACLLLRDPNRRAISTASLLCGFAGIAYAGWWLFYSNGWPRYALIGMGLIAASVACAAAALHRERSTVFASIALLALVAPWGAMDRLAAPVLYAWRNGFVENERVTALRATGRYLNEGQARQSVLAGYWWASLVAIEYVSDGERRTVGFNRLYSARRDLPSTLLLRNPKWDAMAGADSDPAFRSFLANCADRGISFPPITVVRCRFEH